jgi:hypothetical protein
MELNIWGRILFGTIFGGLTLVLWAFAGLTMKLTWAAVVQGRLLG